MTHRSRTAAPANSFSTHLFDDNSKIPANDSPNPKRFKLQPTAWKIAKLRANPTTVIFPKWDIPDRKRTRPQQQHRILDPGHGITGNTLRHFQHDTVRKLR